MFQLIPKNIRTKNDIVFFPQITIASDAVLFFLHLKVYWIKLWIMY